MPVDLRIIIPVICIISITIIIFLIVFRRAALRRGIRVRRVHHPHNTCATYTVPGCETIHACPQPSYPYPAQPVYYQNPPPMPPQHLAYPSYPQAQQQQQPPYPSGPTSSSQPQPNAPPPYYTENTNKL
ncbi:hypothetical protein M3Y97_00098000 [Aphelenchoides bicaudatus]|nr:hypothetical protein M3Y97_00098000 [Aphelenchoides bicaudatus]